MIDIKKTFLQLTSKTYPYGYESELVKFLPKGYSIDLDGNYYFKIGESKTLFACHLDTACKTQTNVTHVIDENTIRTDGSSILGADDKAGMTVILYMISENIPGTYYFFIGEEVGCVGSSAASMRYKDFMKYDRIISFDRRGLNSVITHQRGIRCCSDEFANKLSSNLSKYNMDFKLDDSGVYTDSAEFTSIISECTNISVGYYNEHTKIESQDIKHLELLAIACSKIDWEELPTKRDQSKVEKLVYNYNSHSTTFNDYDYPQHNKKQRRSKNRRNRKENQYNIDKYHTKGRTYYDDLDNEMYESEKCSYISKNVYKSLTDDIFNFDLTIDDLNKVREQFLNMDNSNDISFYNYLESVFLVL